MCWYCGLEYELRKKISYWIILACVLYGAIEASSAFGLYILKEVRHVEFVSPPKVSLSKQHREILNDFLQGKTTYSDFSPTLGWTIKEDGRAPLYRANHQGIRADREYALEASDDAIRISSFGDSYTHCNEVENHETWQEQLRRFDFRLEVLNFGVGGFGLDQALLRYRQEGSRFNSDIVLIGYMTENIFRHVNVFRPFYLPNTGTPLSKPRFQLKNGQLTLIENPMQRLSQYRELLKNPETMLPLLGRNDEFYQTSHKSSALDILPSYRLITVLSHLYGDTGQIIRNGRYQVTSDAYQITVALLDQFYRTVQEDHALPVILIFPEPADIARYHKDGTKRYSPLIDYLSSRNYRYLDLMAAFSDPNNRMEMKELFVPPHFNHYSPGANRMVAESIRQYLQREGLLDQPTAP